MSQYVVNGEILSITTVEIASDWGVVYFSRKLGPVSTNQVPNVETIPLSGNSFWGAIGLHGMGTVQEALNELR